MERTGAKSVANGIHPEKDIVMGRAPDFLLSFNTDIIVRRFEKLNDEQNSC